MVGRVAAQAGGGAMSVRRVRFALMAGAAAAADFARGSAAKTEQQALVSAAVHMIAARTVAGFAPPARRRALLRQLAMGGVANLARHIFVAGQTRFTARILRRLPLPARKTGKQVHQETQTDKPG